VLRAEILRVKNADYVQASIALGVSRFRILVRHVLPNSIAPVIVVITLSLASACVSGDHSATTLSSTPARSTEPTSGTPRSTLPPVTPPPLGPYRLTPWEDCEDDFQCATLSVPLDWTKPAGTKISLAVIRKPATGPGLRIGSVLMNPGGPGAPGVSFLRDTVGSDGVPAHLGDRFDLVSWDPRGTGDSAGIRCLTEAQLQAPDIDPTIDSPADAAAVTAESTNLAEDCKAKDGADLPFVGTKDTARDLDALRGALGDPKLTYVGYSYGTTIGTVYAQLFPGHVRAMVLDGVTAVGADPVADTHAQAQSFEKNLDAFFADCASRSNCLFGDGNPKAAFLALVAKLEAGTRLPGSYALPDDSGATHQRNGTVGVGELYSGVFVTLYSRESWAALEQALAGAANGDGRLLLYLRDQFGGRQDDGSWNHLSEANLAIVCADQAVRPKDPVGDAALRAAWTRELPLVGSVFATGTPGCFDFPAAREPLSVPAAGSIKGVPPIVLVGSTGDPATPYQQAVDMKQVIVGSVLATWDSDDHTGYGRGADCLDTPLTHYLTDLTPPPDGLRCKP